MKDLFKNKAFILAEYFFNLRKKEVDKRKKIYTLKKSVAFTKYYYHLLNQDHKYINYIRFNYSLRIMHLIKHIVGDLKILDAGCGTGSESIICGLLGARVRGIDLSQDRIDIGNLRILYYQKLFNKNMDISLSVGNLFNQDEKYDLIWANESISHIHPFEKFLHFAYKNLTKRGRLLIADPNNLNPYIYYKNKKTQKKKGGIYTKKLNPKTNKFVPYAVERCFSIIDIKSLTSSLFNIEYISPISFFPFFLYKIFGRILFKIENTFLRRIPLLNKLSGIFVISLIKK